jgi:hypothetical protein
MIASRLRPVVASGDRASSPGQVSQASFGRIALLTMTATVQARLDNFRLTEWVFMTSMFVFVGRVIAGVIALSAFWFIFDTIHDRNTEIIVSCIGLLYMFIFMVSRRMQYFGLTIFSLFGRTTAYTQKLPYDDLMRDEIGLEQRAKHAYLNAIFAALIEILCLYRLFSSLLGHGWGLLANPVHSVLQSAAPFFQ